MFLHRRNKIYYLWYYHEDGRRLKISTHSTTKVGAYKFIQTFKQSLTPDGKRKKLVSEFIEEVHSSLQCTPTTKRHSNPVPTNPFTGNTSDSCRRDSS